MLHNATSLETTNNKWLSNASSTSCAVLWDESFIPVQDLLAVVEYRLLFPLSSVDPAKRHDRRFTAPIGEVHISMTSLRQLFKR